MCSHVIMRVVWNITALNVLYKRQFQTLGQCIYQQIQRHCKKASDVLADFADVIKLRTKHRIVGSTVGGLPGMSQQLKLPRSVVLLCCARLFARVYVPLPCRRQAMYSHALADVHMSTRSSMERSPIP
jgi:hypothetical protein